MAEPGDHTAMAVAELMVDVIGGFAPAPLDEPDGAVL